MTLRILFITTYFEPDSGAAAVRLSRLAKLLRQRGHSVSVLAAMPHYPLGRIAEGYRGRFALREDREGLRIMRAWLWATPSARISRKLISQNSFMLTAALRGLGIPRPDVVFIEAQPVFTSLAGVFYSRLKRVPYLLNVSDLWPDHLVSVGALSAAHPVYRAARWLVNANYRGAAAVVTLTPYLQEVIEGYIGADGKTRTILNGVDLTRFTPELRNGPQAQAFRQRHELGQARLVTFVGTFATQYDFGVMLEAAARLKVRQDVRFVLIGSGSQGELVRQRLESGGFTNVTWIGWLDHADVPLAWAAAHVGYWALHDQPLYRGTIPAKLYEALASGTPVAAAMEGRGAEMLAAAGGGFCVPPGDVAGLVAAIERLLDDPSLHQAQSQAARAYAEAHFDPERVADAYENVLLQIARPGR